MQIQRAKPATLPNTTSERRSGICSTTSSACQAMRMGILSVTCVASVVALELNVARISRPRAYHASLSRSSVGIAGVDAISKAHVCTRVGRHTWNSCTISRCGVPAGSSVRRSSRSSAKTLYLRNGGSICFSRVLQHLGTGARQRCCPQRPGRRCHGTGSHSSRLACCIFTDRARGLLHKYPLLVYVRGAS